MSMLFQRHALIPAWLVVFVLYLLLGSPMTFATGAIVLLTGVVGLTITLTLWRKPPPTIADVLRHVEAS